MGGRSKVYGWRWIGWIPIIGWIVIMVRQGRGPVLNSVGACDRALAELDEFGCAAVVTVTFLLLCAILVPAIFRNP